jgi:hypothetical protein
MGLNQAEHSAFIKALFDDFEALGQPLRPAGKLFSGLPMPALEELKRLSYEQLHGLYRVLSRTGCSSHCLRCHPEMACMPFASRINGREYHRRQKARQRRKRRGKH